MTPWSAVCQALLSMGFSKEEYWSGFPYLPPGSLPNLGIEPRASPLQMDSLLSESPGKPIYNGGNLFHKEPCRGILTFYAPFLCVPPRNSWDHLPGKLLLFSSQVMSDSSKPHGLQHARLPCPSPPPRVCPSPVSTCIQIHILYSASRGDQPQRRV